MRTDSRPHRDRVRNASAVRRRGGRGPAIAMACTFTVVAGIAVALAAMYGHSWISASSDGQADGRSVDLQDMAVGAVVLQMDDKRCQRMIFDNHTGRQLDTFKPCEKSELSDANGVPLPMGTVHRLDAISKSFAGKPQ